MLDVAEDVEGICPDAWILQAGNPVFAGTTLMGRETNVKVCGLCHGHYGYANVARTIGLDPDKVVWQAPGLNHNIWLTHFFYQEDEASEPVESYPVLDRWIEENIVQYWKDHAEDGVPARGRPRRSTSTRCTVSSRSGTRRGAAAGGIALDLETRTRWYGAGGGGARPKDALSS